MTIHRISTPDPTLVHARRIARIAEQAPGGVTIQSMRRSAEVLTRSGSPIDWDRAKKLRRIARIEAAKDAALWLTLAAAMSAVAIIGLIMGVWHA